MDSGLVEKGVLCAVMTINAGGCLGFSVRCPWGFFLLPSLPCGCLLNNLEKSYLCGLSDSKTPFEIRRRARWQVEEGERAVPAGSERTAR